MAMESTGGPELSVTKFEPIQTLEASPVPRRRERYRLFKSKRVNHSRRNVTEHTQNAPAKEPKRSGKTIEAQILEQAKGGVIISLPSSSADTSKLRKALQPAFNKKA